LGFSCRSLLISLEASLRSYHIPIIFCRLERFWEIKDDLVIQCFSDLGGHRPDLTLKLFSGVCGYPIYHPREFQGIQSPYPARPNYWPYSRFQGDRTSLGFLQFEEEASVFELHTLGGGYHCPDLSLGGV
jgi:hypothetical protein